jgi:tetratricopeptide (TPR) repeat protein
MSALATVRPRGASVRAFVGRERQIGSLESIYESVADSGRPALVAIVGEPGVGKSRLIDELRHRLGRRTSPPLVRTGRCLSYGRGLTYRAFADILREEFSLLDSDRPAKVLARLGDRAILGLALGLDVSGTLSPEVVRERFARAWIDLLEERLREAPVVVVIEDIHWAEEPLIELLRALRHRVIGPLMIVTTARPEVTEHLPANLRVELDPLTSDDAVEMVSELMGGNFPAQVRNLVVGRAGGNPFFIEELLGTLIDRGLITLTEGVWTMERPVDAQELPDTVQAVLAARVDLLPEVDKRALQAASVVGRIFWDAPVMELVAPAEPDFSVLEQRSFAHRAVESSLVGAIEYAFKHQLTREVAYASLPKAERGRLHAGVARYLERDADDARVPFLAHHYEQSVREEYAALAWAASPDELARLRQSALYWLRIAAGRAASRYETDAAVAMYERAIELSEDDPTRFELWRALASVHSQRYDTRAFVSATERAIALAPDQATSTSLYAELALRSCTAWLAWNPPPAREEVEGWIDRALAGAGANTRERAIALVARGWHSDRDEATAAEALEIAEGLGEPELIGWALRTRAIAAMQGGRYDIATEASERILELLATIEDPGSRETLLENTVLRVAAATGRFDDARRVSGVVSDLVADLTPHNRLHGVAYELEIEELVAGWERIRALEPRVERAVDENRDTPCLRNARSLLLCALAEAALGADAAARRFEDMSATLGIGGHDRSLTAPRLRLAMLRGDEDEARRLLHNHGRPTLRFMFDMAGAMSWLDAAAAFGLAEEVEREAPALAVPGTCFEPFALRALGIVRGDRSLLEQADRRFAELGQDWYAGQLLAGNGQITMRGKRSK